MVRPGVAGLRASKLAPTRQAGGSTQCPVKCRRPLAAAAVLRRATARSRRKWAGGVIARMTVGRVRSGRIACCRSRFWAQADQPDRAAGPGGRDRPGTSRPRRRGSLRTPQGEFTATYGTTRLGARIRPRADTHFRIASITKTMTSAVILQLAQEGKLRLDDRISKYVAGVPNGDNITIAELLEMRSGLYNYTSAPEMAGSSTMTRPRSGRRGKLLAIAFARPPNFRPARPTSTATPTTCCSASSSRRWTAGHWPR